MVSLVLLQATQSVASSFIVIRQPAVFPSFSFSFLRALCGNLTFEPRLSHVSPCPAHAPQHVLLHVNGGWRFYTWGALTLGTL